MHLHVLCRGPIEASDTTLVRVTNKPKIKHLFGWMQVTSPSQALGTARRLRFDTMRDPETIDFELRLIAARAVRSATKVARCRLPHRWTNYLPLPIGADLP